ncbi:MAG: hypothetical protein ACI8VW_002765 [bacterium]
MDGGVGGGVGQRELDLYSIIPTVEATQLQAIAADISDVLDGRRDLLRYEYPCQYEENQFWIVVRLTTFTVGSERCAVLVRQDVTERRLYNQAQHAGGIIRSLRRLMRKHHL